MSNAVLILTGDFTEEYLRTYDGVINAVRHLFDGTPVAAICHGQQILPTADVREGYEMTAFAPLRSECETAGCTWAEDVIRGRNLVTERDWSDLTAVLTPFLGMPGTAVSHAEKPEYLAMADD